MTNQSSDTQPALHSHNVSVRGGRLTKFKGRVASIAPGLSVVATVAVLFSGSAAQAACTYDSFGYAQCGPDAIPTVPPFDTFPGNDPYVDGIVFTEAMAVHTLVLPDHPEFTVLGRGVTLDYVGNEDVFVHMQNGKVTAEANVTRDNYFNHGVSARTTGTGNVKAQLGGEDGLDIQDDEDNITIYSDLSAGLRAQIDNNASAAEAKAVMTGGKITVADGSLSEGVSAFTSGFGNATVEMRGGKIVVAAGLGLRVAVNASTDNNSADYEGRATASMTTGEIETRNINGIGLRATTGGINENAEAFVHMSGGKITTHGEEVVEYAGTPEELRRSGDAHALLAQLGYIPDGDSKAKATAKMTGGEIETIRKNSSGVRALNDALGNATAEMDGTSGTITTHGNRSHGIQAFANPHEDQTTADGRATAAGVAEAKMSAGTITINAHSAHGAYAQAKGILGKALVSMGGGRITTNDSGSYGLYARIDNSNNEQESKVFMDGGSIETEGTGDGGGSHGILADTSGFGDVIVEMQRGTVITRGNGSHGIWAESEAQAKVNGERTDPGSATQAKAFVTVGALAEVTALGSGSDGIRISGNLVDADDDASTPNDLVQLGARGFDIDAAGTVTGGAGNGAAIRTISSDPGTIDIAVTATVTADASGVAIHTVTAGKAGAVTADDDGTATITSAGTITGDILLYAGDDRLIVTDGSITGNVYGSEGNNTLTLERGRFTGDIRLVGGKNILKIEDGRFTGGIYGGEGNDTVTIFADTTYVGSHVLDGGAGDNDQLTLHGQTISNIAANFLNWESVTLNDTTLRLSGVTTVDMDLSIDAGSVFRAFGGEGGMTIAGPKVTNEGSVVFSVQDGNTGDVIRVEGNYTGSDMGSDVFALDARMDGTDTDILHFIGDVSGDMEVLIASVGGVGAEGAPLAIDVVTVDGESGDATFTLVGGNHVMSDGAQAVIAGAYLYTLAETGRGWVLSALSESGGRNWQPSAPIYDSYGQSLLALNGPASLRKRGSSEDFRSLAWDGGPATQSAGSPLWFQMGTEQVTLSEEHSTTGAALDSSIWEMEIGGDVVLSESGAGLLVGGLQFSYATGSASVTSEFGDGSIDTTGLGLGLAATWYDNRRFYVDGQFTFASYSSDLEADRIGTLTEGNGGTGYALSVEAGQQLDLGARLTVIPQAQLSLSSVAFDDFEGERYGEQVTLEDASSQQLRLGLEFGAQEAQETRRLYGIVNLFHEFGAGSEVNVAGATLTTESEPWAVGVGFGGNYALTDRVDLFGEASYATGLSNAGDTSALSANAGLKVVF